MIAITAGANHSKWLSQQPTEGALQIIGGQKVVLLVDSNDHKGVLRACTSLQSDFQAVSGLRPMVCMDTVPKGSVPIIIGSIGRSKFIDKLILEKKVNLDQISGKWESSHVQIVENPLPNVPRALVIAGSDKRGTIYGIYELSEQIGVSPWYWWADVPIKRKKQLFFTPQAQTIEEPKVKYRGIFINDEGPSLSNWVIKNYGDYRHSFYEKVFELLLRLKANYLWPAMWNNCFNQDDPMNMILADEYGIVMGTSHVEPMMRADKEWNRLGFTQGDWNYLTHEQELKEFWKEGILRNKPYESITTIAMRGKIDTPMSETANIALLEKIVRDQRDLIAKYVNPDITKVPQLWALYKEVQEYYEKGMRVPDDVTLLWCDDNWGNIRRLPTEDERKRSGGAGIYYHFDYVGDPRNYKWLNTNPLPKIWEQMNLAYQYGADRIWIVNVGDIKPMEFPISFFMKMAWDPEAMNHDQMQRFAKNWASETFGSEHSSSIAHLLTKTQKINGRRKHELIDSTTFSIVNYREAERVLAEWDELERTALEIEQKLPKEDRDAYFQLVLHPIQASANLTRLYVAVAKNRLYAKQGRTSTALYATLAKNYFAEDKAIQKRYHSLKNGKWEHIMDQTHIGYTYWQQPDKDLMPELAEVTPGSGFGLAVEGDEASWPASAMSPKLPLSDPRSANYRFTIFRRGNETEFPIPTSKDAWLKLIRFEETPDEVTYSATIDWDKAPDGAFSGTIDLELNGNQISIAVPCQNWNKAVPTNFRGYIESDGVITIEPLLGLRAINGTTQFWSPIKDYGRTSDGIEVSPVLSQSVLPGATSARAEYELFTTTKGGATVHVVLSPTLAYQPNQKYRIGVSFNDETPQIFEVPAQYVTPDWEESVRNNCRTVISKHKLLDNGKHALKIWAIDPGMIVQRIIIDLGGLRKSYLGPETTFIDRTSTAN